MALSPKHEREAKEALQESLKAIQKLEAENEMLSYKARAFDTFASFVAMLSPNRSGAAIGGNSDAVWILRKLLAEIEVSEQEQAKKAAANTAAFGQAVKAAEADDGAS